MNIHVTHYLEPHEKLRLKALATAMTAVVTPTMPYTIESLLRIYGASGVADLFREHCCPAYGVRSYYSPPLETEK